MRWWAVVAAFAAIGLGGGSASQPQYMQVKANSASTQETKAQQAPAATGPALKPKPTLPAEVRKGPKGDEHGWTAEPGSAADWAQVAMGFLGLIGLWRTVHWAKRAWEAAAASAKADNDALEETRKEFAEARVDASEQAERFKKQFKLAEESLGASREAAVTMDRAWISVEATLAGPLVFDDDEVRVSVRFRLKNIGRSPAVDIVRNYLLTASLVGENIKIEQRLYWGRARAMRAGFVMLPGVEIDETYSLAMPRLDFMQRVADARAIPGEPTVRLSDGIFPAIIAGVEYSLPGDNKGRSTYMYYCLRRNSEPIDFDGSICIVAIEDMTMMPDIMGGPIT